MPTLEFAPGVVIDGKFRLDRQIGEGGIGTVWVAWQEMVDRKVAIKFLKGDLAADQRDRFLLEARALGRLNHPNCITIYDFGYSESHGALYLVMEYLDGVALSDWRGRVLSSADVIEISKQVANALAYAHHQSVFHRDLKPENVFLVQTYTGETLVKVLDFGLARMGGQTNDRLTKTGEIFGTPAYMSPEQIRGTRHAGAASDIYSLGVMMYEMIERRLPFENMAPFDIMMAHVTSPIPPMERRVVQELEDVVYRCLQKDISARYAGALDLWKALSAVPLGLEEESLSFAAVDAPDETFSGIPLGGDFPTNLQTTPVGDRLGKRAEFPAYATGNAELPTLISGSSPLETIPASLAPVPGRKDTVMDTSPAVSRRSDLWISVSVGAIGVLIVTVLLLVVLREGLEPGPAEQPTEGPAAEVTPDETVANEEPQQMLFGEVEEQLPEAETAAQLVEVDNERDEAEPAAPKKEPKPIKKRRPRRKDSNSSGSKTKDSRKQTLSL